MLKLRHGIAVYVSTHVIDARKSIDTLAMLVCDEFGSDPRSGNLFVFFNRSHDKVKILYWDRNGFVLHYKRLEKNRYIVPKSGQRHYVINEIQLNGLLAGLNFEIMSDFYELDYDKIF